jgi:hypothetical protein
MDQTPIPGTTGFFAPGDLSPEEMDAYLKRLRQGTTPAPGAPEESLTAANAVSPEPPDWNAQRVVDAMRRAGPGNPAPDTSPYSAARAKWRDLGFPEGEVPSHAPAEVLLGGHGAGRTSSQPSPPIKLGPAEGQDSMSITPADEEQAMASAKRGWTYAEGGPSDVGRAFTQEMQPILQRREYELKKTTAEAANNKSDAGVKAAKIHAAAAAAERGIALTFDEDGTPNYQPLDPESIKALSQVRGAGTARGASSATVIVGRGPDGKPVLGFGGGGQPAAAGQPAQAGAQPPQGSAPQSSAGGPPLGKGMLRDPRNPNLAYFQNVPFQFDQQTGKWRRAS